MFVWNTGSGFKSHHSYKSGYFGVAVKLQPGYTAGVITSFYVRINYLIIWINVENWLYITVFPISWINVEYWLYITLLVLILIFIWEL
jgi:hypothetical protein